MQQKRQMDSIFKLFFSYRFWVSILILSSIGAAVSLVMLKNKENLIFRAPEAYICLGSRSKTATLGKISDSTEVYYYLEYVKGNTPFVKWNSGGSIVNGQNVKVLEYSNDSLLLKVLIRREGRTMQYPSEEVHWVYMNYVSDKPC